MLTFLHETRNGTTLPYTKILCFLQKPLTNYAKTSTSFGLNTNQIFYGNYFLVSIGLDFILIICESRSIIYQYVHISKTLSNQGHILNSLEPKQLARVCQYCAHPNRTYTHIKIADVIVQHCSTYHNDHKLRKYSDFIPR